VFVNFQYLKTQFVSSLLKSLCSFYNPSKRMKKTAAYSATSLNNSKNTQTFNPLPLVRSFADTGWRIVVPVVVATFVGAVLDTQVGTKPWLTLVGLVVGFMIAGLLVKHQAPAVDVVAKKH
jgi:F0F1-type ATP synthase assembly protein I